MKKISIPESQYDWAIYWKTRSIPFRNTVIMKKLIRSLGSYSSKSSLRLLKNTKDINSVLEVGGGTGCLSEVITRGLGLGSKSLTLIDLTEEARKVWKLMSGFGQYLIGDFTNYNYKGKKYDLVFSAGLIEHWEDKKERIEVIKKHGDVSKKYVMIRVPRKGGIVKILELREKLAKKDNYLLYYTKEDLKREMTEAGLNVMGIDEDGISVVALAKKT